MTSLLKVEGLRKSFGGVIALRDARFEFEAGAVCALASLTELSSHFVVNVSREAKASREAIERFQIRADCDVNPVASLSARKQRKVVLWKRSLCKPRALPLDEPPRRLCAADRLRYEEPASADRREKGR